MNVDEFRNWQWYRNHRSRRKRAIQPWYWWPACIMTKTLFQNLPDSSSNQKMSMRLKILAFANEHKVPVGPRGAASWDSAASSDRGESSSIITFRNTLELDTVRKTVTSRRAHDGAILISWQKEGLCLMTILSKFPLGRWVSTGGFGINSFRYGHLSKQMVSMTVVQVILRLRAAPTDLISVFHFHWRWFGIVVEITLKLRDVLRGRILIIIFHSIGKHSYSSTCS